MKPITVVVERTSTGYSAFAETHPVATVGQDLAELKANIVEALNLYFGEIGGKPVTADAVRVSLDLPQFFEFYKVINAKQLAARIGMPQALLAQYIGGQKKPGPKQVTRILDGVREVGRELAAMDFAV